MDLEYIQRIGIAAAFKGARILHSYLGNIQNVEKKGAIDLVTEADTASEKSIINTIRSRFPEHTIVAEERGVEKGDDALKWIIDPLDGTTNYVHNLEIFAVSIAFAVDDKPVIGIVLNPCTGELFTGIKDQGACLNGNPIKISKNNTISESLLVTGFPYNFKDDPDPYIKRFGNCLKKARGVRRLGSASLDLCYVACGRFDGFWEQGLQPWDTAAGIVIAKEAGCVITDFQNSPFLVDKKEILATNGKIHNEMLLLLER